MNGGSMTAAGLVLTCAGAAAAAQTAIDSTVESVALFKNGLAVVTRVIEVPESGEYLLEQVPTAVHGTLWLESDALVSAHVEVRQVEVPLDQTAGSNLRDELVDRRVTVCLREPSNVTIDGHVVRLQENATAAQWSRTYETSPYNWYGRSHSTQPNVPRGIAMLLDDGTKRHYIDPSNIALLTVHDPKSTMTRRQPAMRLQVDDPSASYSGPYTVTMTYLAKGITWAPAYLARIGDDSTLRLDQQATIRNELGDINDAEFYLISGFPSIEFSHVDTLAGSTATIAGFFAQLNQRVGGRHAARRDVMSQSAVMTNINAPEVELDLEALAEPGGADIHYQPIGRHSLVLGASMVLNVARGESTFDRVVELIVPDTRNIYGRLITDHNNHFAEGDQQEEGVPWDVVRFDNPFDFPMTTAPIMIVDQERFAGQQMSHWTNPGDRASARITRALSIRATHGETELEDTRTASNRFGRRGNTVDVQGEVALWNHRDETAEIVVRRRFSGELLEASHSPAARLLEEGVFSYNKRNELVWTITLAPGEVVTLHYRHQVFVLR